MTAGYQVSRPDAHHYQPALLDLVPSSTVVGVVATADVYVSNQSRYRKSSCCLNPCGHLSPGSITSKGASAVDVDEGVLVSVDVVNRTV